MFSFSYSFCLLIFTWTWNAKYEPEETVVFYSRKTRRTNRRTNRRTFFTLKTASLSTTANEITEPMLDVSAGGAKCTLHQAHDPVWPRPNATYNIWCVEYKLYVYWDVYHVHECWSLLKYIFIYSLLLT